MVISGNAQAGHLFNRNRKSGTSMTARRQFNDWTILDNADGTDLRDGRRS